MAKIGDYFGAVVLLFFLFCLATAAPAEELSVHTFDCKNCHIPSLSVSQLGDGNVCLSCHDRTLNITLNDGSTGSTVAALNIIDASNAMGNNPGILAGKGQTSHSWSAADSQPRAGAVTPSRAAYPQFYSRFGSSQGKVTCSRCHNPHADRSNPQLLVLGAGSTQQMCLACHVTWDQGSGMTNITHPVNIDYATAVSGHSGKYAGAPPDDDGDLHTAGQISLFDGKILCGTCHQVHFADSNAATVHTPANFATLSSGGGDGKLLRADGAGRADTSALCRSCHTYQAHGDGSGERPGCLVCHSGHSYDPVAPNYYMLRKSVTTTAYGTKAGLDYSSPGVLSAVDKYKFWNDRTDGTANGYCEKCHGDAKDIGAGKGRYHVATAVCTDCHRHNQASGSLAHGDGSVGENCITCHGHDVNFEYESGKLSQGKGSSQSHSTHTEADRDDLRGPNITCNACHDTNAFPYFKSGTDTNGDDRYNLAETDVCNTCHSPAGSYDGVNNAVVGAKDNWDTGIYTDGNLTAGKERWCVTCHDESPANSKADGTGVSARNMVGNNSTWGFYQTGHGANISVDCVQCHSTRMPHIDHIYTPILDVTKTTQNPNNYRFYVGKDMRMPFDSSRARASRELCISCHLEEYLYNGTGTPDEATTNFRADSADGTGYNNLHRSYHQEGSNCITCHDPHGTSAPRMTADDRIGSFRLIRTDGALYYELPRALWDSADDNIGGATTGPASGCGTCHTYVTLSVDNGIPWPNKYYMPMYKRVFVPLNDIFPIVTDLDTDGLPDTNDNCSAVSNESQTDTDGDGVGDACDNSPGGFDPSNRDRDYDGLGDVSDSCPDDPNNDIDGDGVCIGAGFAAPKIGGNDNCPVNSNPTQADTDGDGYPDACDNCPSNANADQADYDLDGSGDACDASCDSFRNVWSQVLYPPGGQFTGVALDASDNVYAAGYVSSALPGLTYVGGYKDFAIVKYDKDGNLLAKAELGSPDDGWEGFEDIAVDNATGSVYATGYTTGALPGQTKLGNLDMVLAKYDADLNQIWAKQLGTAGYDHGLALAIDASGNLYVGERVPSQCALVKYDPDGIELWNKTFGCTEVTSVAVDGAYVYTGGVQAGNAFVKQFGLDGTVGWSSPQGTAETEADTSIVVTGGNVFVAGTTFGSFPGFTLEGTQNIFVLKLNKTDGSLMAATQFNAPDIQQARGIDTDSTGAELYVTGLSMSGFITQTQGIQSDAFLLSFDTDLNVLRRRWMADTSSNENNDIAVSKLDGSIYMAGARSSGGQFTLLKEQKGCP